MSTYVVCYDLNSPGQDYGDLHKAIKALGAWWHNLDSTWLVTSSKTASGLRDYLKPHLDANDKLLVIDITGDPWASRGFTGSGADWLKNNI